MLYIKENWILLILFVNKLYLGKQSGSGIKYMPHIKKKQQKKIWKKY